MKYKVILPDKTETTFENKEESFQFAKSNAVKLNRVISVKYTKDGIEWDQIAIIYPSGKVQEGTGGFGFFKTLSTNRR